MTASRDSRWWLDGAAIAVVVAGWVYLMAGSPPVEIDEAALGDSFRRAGLPDPPDLEGADPVPVGVLLEQARAWVDTASPAAIGGLGQVYQALQEHESALRCFAAAAELDPGEPRWRYGIGTECQALGLHERALEAFHRVTELYPKYPTTYARLGEMFLDRGEHDRAVMIFGTYQILRPSESVGYVGLGRIALAGGRADEAVGLLRRAVAFTPRDFRAHRFLAQALAAGGQRDLARQEQAISERLPQYSGWLTFDPWLQASHELARTQRFLTNQMRVAAGAGDYESVAEAAAELLERRPDDWGTLGNLASVYRHLGRLDEADAAVSRAIELMADSSLLHCIRAEIAFAREDLAGAERAVGTALDLDAQSARAWELRGRLSFLDQRHDEGIAAVAQAVDLEPWSAERWLLLGQMLSAAGRQEEAAVALREHLALEPGNEAVRRLLQQLEAGEGD